MAQRPSSISQLQKSLNVQPHPRSAVLTTLSEKEMLDVLRWFLAPSVQNCPVWWGACYHASLCDFQPWRHLLQRDPMLDLDILARTALPVYVYPYKDTPDRLLCTNIYLTPEQRVYWPSLDALHGELLSRNRLSFKAHSRDFRRLIEDKLVLKPSSNSSQALDEYSSWYLLR